MDISQFKELIKASKKIYCALKYEGAKKITKEELTTSRFAFASVVSIRDIKKNEKFSENNIWVKRPGTGEILAPNFYNVIGKIAKRDISSGVYIKKKYIK